MPHFRPHPGADPERSSAPAPQPTPTQVPVRAGGAGAAPTGPVRLLLVDDDPLTRGAVRQYLQPPERFQVVAEAADGLQAVDAVSRYAVDVVLMDLGMPVMNGVEATRRICDAPTHPHVVALTTWDVDDAVVRAIEAGASGYLLKVEAPQGLTAALDRVMAGEPVLSPGAMQQLLAHVRTQGGAPPPVLAPSGQGAVPGSAGPAGPGGAGPAAVPVGEDPWAQAREAAASLTEREVEVVAGAAKGLNNKEIGERFYISPSTVKSLLSSAQTRLGVRNRTQAAVLATRAGLLG